MARDPLPSWRAGKAKSAILDFAARVTDPGGAEFVPVPERIAAFDNDGTLWCEQPFLPQFYFARERLDALVKREPDLAGRAPFKPYVERDMPAIKQLGKRGLLEVVAAVHGGTTVDEFAAIAREWLGRATNPELGRRFVDLVYAPQLELLDYLRASGFKCFIVSGGGIDLIRGFAEAVYGIPPERVVGSSERLHFELRGDKGVIVKEAALASFDDREVKPVNIALHIGRRPILVFGNSDGDLAMMRYALSGEGARLALLLHHDDAAREFEYDRDYVISPLSEALDKADDYGITLVSMKGDWDRVFVEEDGGDRS